MLAGPAAARAQDIEPRAYSNAPVGVNFLVGSHAFTRGGLSFDPSIPVRNAKLDTSNAVLGYARVLDLWGMSGKSPHGPGLTRCAKRICGPTHMAKAHFSQPRWPLSRSARYAK